MPQRLLTVALKQQPVLLPDVKRCKDVSPVDVLRPMDEIAPGLLVAGCAGAFDSDHKRDVALLMKRPHRPHHHIVDGRHFIDAGSVSTFTRSISGLSRIEFQEFSRLSDHVFHRKYLPSNRGPLSPVSTLNVV